LGAFLSTARLTNRFAEELYRQWLAASGRRAGRIVILDRDFLLDYHASDVSAGAQRSLGRRVHGAFLLRLYRRPDFVVYLDAPPDVLFARKGEGTLEWLAQRRQDYQAALQLVPRYAVVNAARPIDEVVGEVVGVVRSAVEERSSSRGQTGAQRNDR
jgi:thymidylate kinase